MKDEGVGLSLREEEKGKEKKRVKVVIVCRGNLLFGSVREKEVRG